MLTNCIPVMCAQYISVIAIKKLGCLKNNNKRKNKRMTPTCNAAY